MMSTVDSILAILIGLFTGIATGLTGASGVMIAVPLLNLLLRFSVHESIGTSLMVDVIAPLAVSYTYYRHGNVNIKSGILIFVLDFPLHEAIGTSTLIMAITAFSGAIGYASRGNVNLIGGLVVGLSAAVGGVASAKFANKSTEDALTKALSGLFIFLGIVMTVLRLM